MGTVPKEEAGKWGQSPSSRKMGTVPKAGKWAGKWGQSPECPRSQGCGEMKRENGDSPRCERERKMGIVPRVSPGCPSLGVQSPEDEGMDVMCDGGKWGQSPECPRSQGRGEMKKEVAMEENGDSPRCERERIVPRVSPGCPSLGVQSPEDEGMDVMCDGTDKWGWFHNHNDAIKNKRRGLKGTKRTGRQTVQIFTLCKN